MARRSSPAGTASSPASAPPSNSDARRPIDSFCAAEDAVAHAFVASLDETCAITGADGHHLQRVRRLRVGETITCADGSGSWRRYEVTDSAGGRLALAADGPVRQEPALTPVTLALALTKHALDQVVARCTEIGVDEILPVRAQRSVVRWNDERTATIVERLRVISREAAAQSRRARIPRIGTVATLGDLAGRSGLLIADRSGVTAPALDPPGPAGWTVLIGPEGGFDPDELAPFAASVPRLAVGPHVLRAETAPIAVVAALRSVAPSGRR